MFIYCKQLLGIVKSNRVKVLLIPSFFLKKCYGFLQSLKTLLYLQLWKSQVKKNVTFSYKKKKFKSLKI